MTNTNNMGEEVVNKYTAPYNSFDELCSNLDTMEDLMSWFKINDVKWPDRTRTDFSLDTSPFYWPDNVVKDKIASCYHQAVLEHYFCKRKHIDHVIVDYIRFRLSTNNVYFRRGHCNVLYKRYNEWWSIFDLHGRPGNDTKYSSEEIKTGCIREPYKTWQEAAINYNKIKNKAEQDNFELDKTKKRYKCFVPSSIYLFTDEMYKVLDENYGNPEFMLKDHYNAKTLKPLTDIL